MPASESNNNQCAIIICPGGSYSSLSRWNEGYFWIPFFHRLGYTVAVLEYRMPCFDYHKPIIDGGEAVSLMRSLSGKFNIDKGRVGLVGFSAGGHIASTLMVSEDTLVRPNFTALFYPVISMTKELTHTWSHDHLLGKNATKELEYHLSNELHITNSTPPVFIALSKDDNVVNPQNSIRFYNAMIANSRPAIIHIYPSGGHGWGYRKSFKYHQKMKSDLKRWLKKMEKQS